MATVLVVDDMAICRDPIAATLTAAGHTALCARDGKEGLALVFKHNPDVVLLDLLMPGVNGLMFLRALRNNPSVRHTPVLLLTAATDKILFLHALKLGIRGAILKSNFTVTGMLARVAECVAKTPVPSASESTVGKVVEQSENSAKSAAAKPSKVASPASTTTQTEIPQLLTREQCVARAERAMQAKALSGVVAQVISLATSPRGDMSQLATLIGRDPVLSYRVLQAANSPVYRSTRGMVTSIPDAVRQIGCNSVRNIAAALGVFEAMPASSPGGFNPIRCWQHSFAVANLCEALAAGQSDYAAGVPFLIGLCHDLGEILFHTQFGPEFEQIKAVRERTQKPFIELERYMLGITRGQLVTTILRCMSLPDAISGPIESHHVPEKALRSDRKMAMILRMADEYAHGILLASSEDAPVGLFGGSDCEAAVGERNPKLPDVDALRNEVYALTGMLARFSPAEEAQLMTPLFPQSKTHVWIARDPGLSEFDPLVAALRSIAEVRIDHRLPTSEEQALYQKIIVLTRTASATGLNAATLKRASVDKPLLWVIARNDSHMAGVSQQGLDVHCPTVSLRELNAFICAAEQASEAAA